MTDLPRARAEPLVQSDAEGLTFQARVDPWLIACFGEEIARDREERNHRFLEEALELVQSCGCTASEAHQLVDYVYGRPMGVSIQEIGGVMVTLAALCLAQHLDMHQAGEIELARVWTKVEKIRAKQAAKPKHSPLPEAAEAKLAATPPNASAAEVTEALRALLDWISQISEEQNWGWNTFTTPDVVVGAALALHNAALAKADAGGRPGPVAEEAVAMVVFYDPSIDPTALRPRKIIDGSIEFMDAAPIGTKLYASRQTPKPDAGSSGEVTDEMKSAVYDALYDALPKLPKLTYRDDGHPNNQGSPRWSAAREGGWEEAVCIAVLQASRQLPQK